MAKFCSQCGFSVGENDKFCPDCGAPLRTRAEFEYSDHYCSECGSQIIVRMAEAIYRPRAEGQAAAPPPRRSEPQAAVQRDTPRAPTAAPAQSAATTEEPAGGVSGCSVLFWILVLAAVVWACYAYIYVPYQASRASDESTIIQPRNGNAVFEERTGPTYTIPPRDEGVSGTGGEGASTAQGDGDGETTPFVGPDAGTESDTQGWVAEPRPERQGYSTVSPDGQAAEAQPHFDLQLVGFRWQPLGFAPNTNTIGPNREPQLTAIVAEGEIMNIAGSPLPTVVANVKFFSLSGDEVAMQSVTINRLPLAIGETARFRAEIPFDSRVYRVDVEFVNVDGAAYSVKRGDAGVGHFTQ
jgi:DNA-directed RNA polymerase subunit RPC12/RpoP